MMFNLSNKVVVVVGGNGYLGNKICTSLKEAGSKVISIDSKDRSLVQSKSSSKNKQNRNNDLSLKVDITNKVKVKNTAKSILKDFKKIDAVVFSVTCKPNDFYENFVDCSIEGWKSVIDVELNGAFNTAQYFGKIMENQKYGNFIFISSIYGLVGNDQNIYKGSNLSDIYLKSDKKKKSSKSQIFSHAVYPTVKGGIISFSRFLAAYWGSANIRVNCISPGGIEHKSENKKFINNYSKKVPLGRKARLEDVTGGVIYLISDESSYITGHNLVIDGGYTIW